MALHLGRFILYSQKPQELAQFFSELLDMEIELNPEDDSITMQGLSHLKLLIMLDPSGGGLGHNKGERDTVIELEFDTLQELEDLLLKVQFISYRHGEMKESKAKLTKMGRDVFFFLKDLDGRRWKFSFKSGS